MKYTLDKSTHSLIITSFNIHDNSFPEYTDSILNDIIDLCIETESVSVALTFQDFMHVDFPDNQEYHRQGQGFPYVVYKGILILSTSKDKMKEELANLELKLNPPHELHLVENE